jgi:hypothetical protein
MEIGGKGDVLSKTYHISTFPPQINLELLYERILRGKKSVTNYGMAMPLV